MENIVYIYIYIYIVKSRVYDSIILGLSKRTVRNICMEYDKGTGSFSSPKKRYSGSRVNKDADNFDQEALRRMIHSFYKKKENLTLHKILVNNRYRKMMLALCSTETCKRARCIFRGKDFIAQGIERYHKKINNKK